MQSLSLVFTESESLIFRQKTKLLVATLDVSGLPVQGPAVNERPTLTHALPSNPYTHSLPFPCQIGSRAATAHALLRLAHPSPSRQSWNFPSCQLPLCFLVELSYVCRVQDMTAVIILPPPQLLPLVTLPPLPRQQDYPVQVQL